ncbi:MAG: hypothetical protein JNM88_14045, partial [Chitinophagaceae bacterium]|nr:hypothetical protein [Chitinophagaceae bacterium]
METTIHVTVSVKETTDSKSNALAGSLTAAAWLIARSALWNGKKIEAPDQEEAQRFIHEFITRNRQHAQNYEELVIRLLAERFHRIQLGHYKIPSPATWFHDPVRGFQGTDKLGRLILNKRLTEQHYKGHWIDFAWAVWYSMPVTPVIFHRWRSHFAEISQSMLNLYLACMQNSTRTNQ